MNDAIEVAEVQVYPPWREAVKRFLGAGFQPGAVVPHAWFWEAFGLDMPRPDTPAIEYDRLKFAFMKQFEPFRTELLTEHQIDISSQRSQGYRITPPADQTQKAFGDGITDIRKGLRRMAARVSNTNLTQLSAEQRRENADTLAKVSILAQAVRRVPRLPAPPNE